MQSAHDVDTTIRPRIAFASNSRLHSHNRGRNVRAGSPHRRRIPHTTQTHHADETRLPHRQRPLRRAHPARRVRLCATCRHASAGRRYLSRLIFFLEIGHPDLRDARTPSDAASGGVFRCAFARQSTRIRAIAHQHPPHPGQDGPRTGMSLPTRRRCFDSKGAVPWCWARAAGRGCTHGLTLRHEASMRNIDRTASSGTGFRPVRCARRCRGVCPVPGGGVPR